MFSEQGQEKLKAVASYDISIWEVNSPKNFIKRDQVNQKINEVLWQLTRTEPLSFTHEQLFWLMNQERLYYKTQIREKKKENNKEI